MTHIINQASNPATDQAAGCHTALRAAVACVAVCGAVMLFVGCAGVPQTAPRPPTPPPSPSSTVLPAAPALVRITGRIDDIDGAEWIVTTDDGQQHTIATSRLTRFGTTTQHLPRAEFPIGTRALIIGWMSGDTITASRVSPPTTPPDHS